jgi:hypothetical protein
VVVSWQDFEQAQPALADFGKKRIDGKVAYLATNSSENEAGLAEGIWPRVRPYHCDHRRWKVLCVF